MKKRKLRKSIKYAMIVYLSVTMPIVVMIDHIEDQALLLTSFLLILDVISVWSLSKFG